MRRVTEWRLWERPTVAVWWARRSVNGVREAKSTECRERKAALAKIKRWNLQVAAGAIYSTADTTTLGEMIQLMLQRAAEDVEAGELAEATHEIKEQKAGHIIRVLGDHTPMSEVGAARVADYERTRRAEGASRHTIQKELSVLKQTLELAYRQGAFTQDPALIMPAGWSHGVYKPRERVLTRDELARLELDLPPHRLARVLFHVATGARTSEGLRALRADVRLADGFILLRGTKTEGSWREVPITAHWRPVLERALALTPVREDGKLFEHWTNLLRDLRVACKNAEVDHCSVNDFRRTFATELVESGMAPHLVGRLLGHTAKSQLVDLVYAQKLRREQFASLLNKGTPSEPPSPDA